MQILPVIDLLAGAVVRGVGGRRDEYRPIQSPLCATPEPLAVAHAIRKKFWLTEFYLADLDAIQGGKPKGEVYRQLTADGFSLWIDAGLETADQVQAYDAVGDGEQTVVAGLETLRSPQELRRLIDRLGDHRVAFSLDLKSGQPLARSGAWHGQSPLQIARLAIEAGVRRLIVLDLAEVGQSRGVGTLELCREIRAVDRGLKIVAGGGVRGPHDLTALADVGCTAALVASALHDGRVTSDDVRRMQML